MLEEPVVRKNTKYQNNLTSYLHVVEFLFFYFSEYFQVSKESMDDFYIQEKNHFRLRHQ